MILKNFKIEDSYGLDYDGIFFDLHSNYNFVKFSYDVFLRSAILEWTKCEAVWAEKEIYKSLKLKFDLVSVFSVRSRDENQPFSEDDCLSHIGYLHPDDIAVMDGFLPKKMARDSWHLVLGFESGIVIKLHSETVELILSLE